MTKFKTSSDVDAHLAPFQGLGEVVRQHAKTHGVALVDLLNGNKAIVARDTRAAVVAELFDAGEPRATIARLLCVTLTSINRFVPEAAKKKRKPYLSHGLSETPEYRAWQTMRLRCTNPENQAYPDYGGRGIWVCSRWLSSPVAFLEDMGPKPSPAYEIDRINNDGGYTCGECDDCKSRGAPANCRWTTRSTNDRNRRNNRIIDYDGQRLTLVEWCQKYGLVPETVSGRLDRGWSVAKALTTPAMRRGVAKRRGPQEEAA